MANQLSAAQAIQSFENHSSSKRNQQPQLATQQQQKQPGLAEKLDAAMSSQTTADEELEIKDRIDDAAPKGPKKADQYSGGRVMVGETGDLNDLAARRQSP